MRRAALAVCAATLAAPSWAFVAMPPTTVAAGQRRATLAGGCLRPRVSTLRASVDATEGQASQAQILAQELKSDLTQMFDLAYEPKWSLYAEDVLFQDPLTRFRGMKKYQDNIQMLKDSPLFTGGKMDLHEVTVVDDTRVDTRWTLSMTFKPFPWQPRLLFTGSLAHRPARGRACCALRGTAPLKTSTTRRHHKIHPG